MSVGIVVVSHSHALAGAAIELANEMVPEDRRPMVVNAGGLDEETFGTDAMTVMSAIEEADSPDGVLVLMDLGSAVLSAQMSLEFVDPEVAERVTLTAAPLVEGLVAAVVTASTGASREQVAREATRALTAKAEAVGDDVGAEAVDEAGSGDAWDAVGEVTLGDPAGIHARPAARLVAIVGGAGVRAELESAGQRAAADSISELVALPGRGGAVVQVRVAGENAQAGLTQIIEFLESVPAQETGAPASADGHAGAGHSPGEEEPGADGTETGAPASDNAEVTDVAELAETTVFVVSRRVDAAEHSASADEEARVESATAQVSAYLASLGERTHVEIFQAQAALLTDRAITKKIAALLAEGSNALDAVSEAFGAAAEKFAALPDPYLAARSEDVRELGALTMQALAGAELGLEIPHGATVMVPELDAATAAEAAFAGARAILTSAGESSGHGTIIARDHEIPVIPAVPRNW
ncbi:dihydroxyacetone kinase phosphotransfer subunit [Arcanobacterium wilhelmae]|uniref:Phosphocarrier protein HPr n=1 Tax=Arcanobacterium wilhelmae TaxID=1803177 RepID=A0ABT9NCR9_9ACTO|nr:dihydroxyacetone kinase phosphoryl donor subunit DhaM [Arcanobacterium wilhelmae]MDP9801300.1 dihydroxyacetone kinase phosphotransfer subunit [Arcanobacterium wilhelmae]WFN90644.1 dihydroxyacetone kinase phosphoryl donor subunit DhaM [Arcanobacterium wilhelmae]